MHKFILVGLLVAVFPVLLNGQGTEARTDLGPDAPRVLLKNQNGSIRILRD